MLHASGVQIVLLHCQQHQPKNWFHEVPQFIIQSSMSRLQLYGFPVGWVYTVKKRGISNLPKLYAVSYVGQKEDGSWVLSSNAHLSKAGKLMKVSILLHNQLHNYIFLAVVNIFHQIPWLHIRWRRKHWYQQVHLDQCDVHWPGNCQCRRNL